jgi:hypothetical protein
MSGLDPLALAGLANNVVAAAELAFIEAALDLGVSADVLHAQLSVGDFLTATVLPAQNGHDVLEIFGRPVAAQLPPDVRPGETLVLQITGFSGNRIVVRNMGPHDPENPVRTVTLQLPPAATRTQTESEPLPPAPQQTAAPQASRTPLSPPREVLLAASIRPALTTAVQQTVHAAQQAANAVQRAVRSAGDVLKAIRVPDTPFTRTAAAIAPQAPARLPTVLQRLEAALPRESEDPRIATLRTLIAFTARMNPANEETLPAQLAAYVSHVIEGSETKLQQLLQAHVESDAAMPKPQPVVEAPVQQTGAPQAQPAEPQAMQAQSTQTQSTQTPPPQAAPVEARRTMHLSQARVVERAQAAQHDLKSVVLSLLRDPQIVRTPTLSQALNETLITLTGTQLNVLSANAQDPATVSFAIPLFYHEGGKPAYLRIGRDSQSRGAKLDADNFHVAFVLDTAHLGTVAIDLESTGRAVKVHVKTERAAAASRFADSLNSLRSRLEQLRYRVTSAAAQAMKKEAAPITAMKHMQKHAAKGLDLRA